MIGRLTQSIRHRLVSIIAIAVLSAGGMGADRQLSAAEPAFEGDVPVPGGAGRPLEPIDFNVDIRPILSDACFHCHGPDQTHRKAGLRLDREDGLRRAFEPGDREASEGWWRITSEFADEVMPPPESHKELTGDQIEAIGRWIDQGADFEGHWAFATPSLPELPAVEHPEWVTNPIDAFVLARLEANGLKPNAEADRERLLRRLCLDLTGLPPTLEQIDAFLNDDAPDAYQRQVDRLLDSPRFGERMALMWLDLARYGDTSVFHADGPRDMWPWRDWVIGSYNGNRPFDQFTRDQIAGDLVDDPEVDQLIATGFLRNNATTDEGGAIAEEYRVEYAVDRVKTTSMVWLGLTMECAQCHDHKYDPISQDEYYRFYAYFNQAADPGMQTRQGNQRPVVDVPNRIGERRAEPLRSQLADLEQRIATRRSESEPAFQAWVDRLDAEAIDSPARPEDAVIALDFESADLSPAQVEGNPEPFEGPVGQALWLDGRTALSLSDLGDFERDHGFSYGAWIKPEGQAQRAVIARMDDLDANRGYDLYVGDSRFSAHIVHRWPDDAIKVTTKEEFDPDAWHHVLVTYDGSSRARGITIYVDGKPAELRVEQDSLRKTIRTKVPLTIGRRTPGSPYKGAVDEVVLFDRTLSPIEVAALADRDPLAEILALDPEERTEDQRERLRDHFLEFVDEPARALIARRDVLADRIRSLTAPISSVMVMQDVETPRPTYVLNRGQYDAPMEDRPVEPSVPKVLTPMSSEAQANRLGLADWLIDPEHPLTARVAVNRYWMMFFGSGLVRSAEDFGSQGTPPSHPELLDWLAVDFVRSGWDIKRTLRQIVNSSTYRQASTVRPDPLAVDPENRWLWRGPRFRLQAEMVRDNALAASGLMVDTIGGPSVKPYQPPGLWNEVSLSGNVRFVADAGAKLFRRGMYTYWKRSAPAPTMTIFDAPTRERCVIRRGRTNTPLQALVGLNDPQFLEAARHLAERVAREVGDDPEARVVRAYRLATGSRPEPAVVARLVDAFEHERAVFEGQPERAEALLAVGESPRDTSLDPADHAALTLVCSIILNLDAALTKG